ncbi:hypothetical protein D9M68_649850 [compost metagenome]
MLSCIRMNDSALVPSATAKAKCKAGSVRHRRVGYCCTTALTFVLPNPTLNRSNLPLCPLGSANGVRAPVPEGAYT